MEPDLFPVEIFTRIASLCSPFSLSRLLLSSKLFYNGSYSGIIEEVDDAQILAELKDICDTKGPHKYPFKTSLACIKSLVLHLSKNAKQLRSLTLTNHFYHDDDSGADENDFLDEETEPEHPLIPILLARGKQLRHVSLTNFSTEDLKKLLDALDPSNLKSLSINAGRGWYDTAEPVAEFLNKGCASLEEFAFTSSSESSDQLVLDALIKSSGSLKYFEYGTDSYGIDPSHKARAATFAGLFSKVAHKNKDTIEAITIAGPAKGATVFSEFLGVESIVASVKTVEDIERMDAICREKYCVPLCNLMWYRHVFFWPRLEQIIHEFPWQTEHHDFARVLYDKICMQLNVHNVKAIRNSLCYLANINSHVLDYGPAAMLLADLMARHLNQSVHLGLLSFKYDTAQIFRLACGVHQRVSPLPLTVALHQCLEINPDLISCTANSGGALAQICGVQYDQPRQGSIDINRRLFDSSQTILFLLLEQPNRDKYEDGALVHALDFRAIVSYPSFDPSITSPNGESCFELLLKEATGRNEKECLEIIGIALGRLANHPHKISTLQRMNQTLVQRLLTKDITRRSFARMLSSDWKIVISDQLLEYIYDNDRFDVLHDLLEESAKGSLGLGKVTPLQKLEMADVLWRYVMAWGDEEYFGWMAKETAKHFPGSAPEWLVEFMEGSDLPEDIEYAWDVDSMRKILLKLRIA